MVTSTPREAPGAPKIPDGMGEIQHPVAAACG
jgi:hypothetical protein